MVVPLIRPYSRHQPTKNNRNKLHEFLSSFFFCKRKRVRMLFVVAKLLCSCMFFVVDDSCWKNRADIPKKSACGKEFLKNDHNMYKLFNHDWYPNVPYLHTNRLANSQWISMKKHSVEHPGTNPKSIMHSKHCTLPYLLLEIPKYYQPKKKGKTLKWPNFLHILKKIYDLSSNMYVYIYMYIGRFIIWHMLWCTLILPFFRLFLITSLTFPHSQRNTSYVRLDTVGHWWPVRTWRMGHSDIPFFKQPWWYLETTSEKT